MPIGISVLLKDDLESSQVSVDGFKLEPFDNDHAEIFGIPRQVVSGGYNEARHGKLWGCINNWWGRFPNEFVMRDPVLSSGARNVPAEWTPYADAWGADNQVLVEQKAVGCQLIETTGGVDSFLAGKVRNYGDTVQPGQEFSLDYNEEFQFTKEKSTELGLSTTVGYAVEVGGEYGGFSATATYSVEVTASASRTTGESKTNIEGKSVTLKANVDAEPHSLYPVSVSFGKGSLKVKVDYEYRLKGMWRALYTKKAYNGQLGSPLADVNELLDALNLPRVIKDSEILDVGFVTNGDINIGAAEPIRM